MKNSIKSKMFVSAIAIALSGASALAATSGEITIQGDVAAINEIVVASQTGFNTLALAAGETDKNVAIVTEKNNNTAGYTVTLSSANAVVDGDTVARLKSGTNAIAYTMEYDSVAVSLAVDGTSEVTSSGSPTGAAGVDKNLTVTTPAGWYNAGTYSDTLTLTIASN